MQFLGNKPKRHYSNMKTLGISIYISYILGLHPWWILHAGRVHWCWTSETLGARHGIIIFFIMSSIWDFISCTTFWISMLLLSQVLVSLQYRVGPLGFLCLPDDQIGGNVGLMDQVERKNWKRRVKLTTGTTTCELVNKHCQRHNGPEGWVHITSSYKNLDQTSIPESQLS